MSGEAEESRKVLQVCELTRAIKSLLERDIGSVWVEGELSNLRRPASGHCYFTLKDETSQIAAVLFRGNQRGLSFQPADGMLVRVLGDISVYERGGNYQVIVRQMEQGGKGALQARFEALKKKLKKAGLFDPERKQPLPMLPQHVGIVTSRTGAAIRDIMNVVMRRFPNLHIVLAPVKVQGEGAAEEIAAAIDLLNGRGGLDALIVGRGGGSLEDLWCFNEEVVALAISRSSIPVISAVGHEIDFTISDFVADLRAPTPSAAAELVVGRKDAFEERLTQRGAAMTRTLRECLLRAGNRLLAARGSPVFQEPAGVVARHAHRLDTLGLHLAHAMRGRLGEGVQRVDDLALRATHAARLRQQSYAESVRRMAGQLRALNPLAVLDRGYSVTTDMDGKVVRGVGDVEKDMLLRTRLTDGTVLSKVSDTERAGREAGGSAKSKEG